MHVAQDVSSELHQLHQQLQQAYETLAELLEQGKLLRQSQS